MEFIELPLIGGSLEDVAGGGGGTNGMFNGNADDDDIDEDGIPSTQKSYENDSTIKPDFSALKSNLRHVRVTILSFIFCYTAY